MYYIKCHSHTYNINYITVYHNKQAARIGFLLEKGSASMIWKVCLFHTHALVVLLSG